MTRINITILYCVLLMLTGCGPPQAKRMPLHKVHRIRELTKPESTHSCLCVHIKAPHSESIYILGEAEDRSAFVEMFSFLKGEKCYPNADTLNSRMPETLCSAFGTETVFTQTDEYWYLPDAVAPLYGYAAYSSSSQVFYLEYHWGF